MVSSLNTERLKGAMFQKDALRAFNLGDLHAAYPLYGEAENCYRAAFKIPGDRVFFMQASAVRCLGELVEQRPNLIELYRAEANRFLVEWTDAEIKSKMSSERVEEAISFSRWIAVNLQSNIFHDAYMAARGGMLTEAQALFERAIAGLVEDPERDAVSALGRAKLELLAADQEMAKRRVDRNLRRVASANLRAARFLMLPPGTTSRQASTISRRRYIALSEALKWRATEYLGHHSLSNEDVLRSLECAERYLHRAAEYTRRAWLESTTANLPSIQHSVVKYTYLTVRERVALLRFMLTGDSQHFDAAIQAWRQAMETVSALSVEGRATLFPRYFYSSKDLEIEDVFLRAARAFRDERWNDSINLLQEWIDRSPIEYRWSWRYSNVLVRLLGTTVIANMFSQQPDRTALHEQIRRLDEFARNEPIGPTGRRFSAEIVGIDLRRAYERKDIILRELCSYFPLDSAVDTYDRPKDTDLFRSLPRRIARGFSQAPAVTETQVAVSKVELLSSIEAFLGYICDYDAQWSHPAVELPQPGIRPFVHFCRQFSWAGRQENEQALGELEALVSQCEAASSAKDYSPLYEQVRQTICRLLKFAPLKVSLSSKFTDIDENAYIETLPDWSIDDLERSSIRISVSSDALLPIEPGEYYLPPLWRNGTRLFYRVDPNDNSPLHPVRFKPRWDYWDRALRNTLFWLPNGVTYQHLERAVELAAKSIPDDDERSSPSVGALILKEGEVLAEAYRNEFGQHANMHAEETALDKCKKIDLAGAVAITTLEPCVDGRRHSKTTCAHLLLQAGIEHVIIGMLDPNPRIRGTSEGLFSKNGVSVYYFPSELRDQIRALNRDFIQAQEKGQFRTIHHYHAQK
jgi:pyrimidine deaminase RibD-like protein